MWSPGNWIRVVIYAAIAFLTVAQQDLSQNKFSTVTIIAATVSALVAVRAYIDQTISQSTNPPVIPNPPPEVKELKLEVKPGN